MTTEFPTTGEFSLFDFATFVSGNIVGYSAETGISTQNLFELSEANGFLLASGDFSPPYSFSKFGGMNAKIPSLTLLGSSSVYAEFNITGATPYICLLYTSPSPRDRTRSRMPSSA